MKKKLVLLLAINIILLGGCSKKEATSVIYMDDFVLQLHTDNVYSREVNTEKITPAVKDDLVGLYTIKNEKGFNDSIIVVKAPNTYDDIELFVERNTADIARPNYDEDGEKNTSLDNCTTDIEMIVKKSLFDDEDSPLYFLQSFFLTEDDAYIVSAATDDEDSYDQLYKDFKNISCR